MSRIVRVVGSGAIIRVEILLPRSGIFRGVDGVVVLKGGGGEVGGCLVCIGI